MEHFENEQRIISIFQSSDKESLFYRAAIETEFKVTPDILATILISMCDNITKCVPEQHLQEFDDALVKFFVENYKNRFNSNEVEYVPE